MTPDSHSRTSGRDSSAKWVSSAGDDGSWKQTLEIQWEGSRWTAPTKWTLRGSDYDMDKEWHSRYMKYGEGDGLMIPPEAVTRGRSLRELTLKTIEGQILPCRLGPRQRRMIHRRTILCGREKIAVSIGSRLPHQEINGGLSYDRRQRCQVWQEIPLMPALYLTALKSINESEGDAVKGSRSDAGRWW